MDSQWDWALNCYSVAEQPDWDKSKGSQFNLTGLQDKRKTTSINSQEMGEDGVLVEVYHVGAEIQGKNVCVRTCASYLMHDHEGAGWRGEQVQRQPACGLEGRCYRKRRRKKRTELSTETLPFHRTSFPLVTSESLLWLNLSRPHREERGGRTWITINIQQEYVTKSNTKTGGNRSREL